MGELLSLSSCHMIRHTEDMCQKCHHPTSCEGHLCSSIMGNNIQSCSSPSLSLDGRKDCGDFGKDDSKGKTNRKIIPACRTLPFSHLQKQFQVTLLSTNGQLGGCPSRECFGCIFCLHHHMAELYQGHRAL